MRCVHNTAVGKKLGIEKNIHSFHIKIKTMHYTAFPWRLF